MSLMTSRQIRSASSGLIYRAETINYRTLRPVPGGLHCPRVFGDYRPLRCLCGRLAGVQRIGARCADCGTQVAGPSPNHQVGHIELCCPVPHPLARGSSDKIAMLLGITNMEAERVLNHEAGLVWLNLPCASADTTELEVQRTRIIEDVVEDLRTEAQGLRRALAARVGPEYSRSSIYERDILVILDEAEALEQRATFYEESITAVFRGVCADHRLSELGTAVCAFVEPEVLEIMGSCAGAHILCGRGPRAVASVLEGISLPALERALTRNRSDLPNRIRLEVVEGLLASRLEPIDLMLSCVPVSPIRCRPVVLAHQGRIFTSEVDDLYRLVILRNDRLRRLASATTSSILVEAAERMLCEAVGALLGEGLVFDRIDRSGDVWYERASVADSVGRKRAHMWKRRLDHSAVGPVSPSSSYRPWEVGVPPSAAAKMLEPAVLGELLRCDTSLGAASALLRLREGDLTRDQHVLAILRRLLAAGPMLVTSESGTGRRVLALQPVLSESPRFEISPFLCNAGILEGEQISVCTLHTPEAVDELSGMLEALVLELSEKASVSPETILGPEPWRVLSDATRVARDHPYPHAFCSEDELLRAYDAGALDPSDAVDVRINGVRVTTSLNRILIRCAVDRGGHLDATSFDMPGMIALLASRPPRQFLDALCSLASIAATISPRRFDRIPRPQLRATEPVRFFADVGHRRRAQSQRLAGEYRSCAATRQALLENESELLDSIPALRAIRWPDGSTESEA